MWSTLVNYVSIHHDDLLKLVGGAAGLSVALESLLLKLKRSKFHLDSKKLSYTLLHVATIVTTVATYLIANVPKADAGSIYATLTIAAETWHRFAVSPLFTKYIVPGLDAVAENKAITAQTSTPVPETPAPAPVDPAPPTSFLGEE